MNQYVVFGLGLSGEATVKFLLNQNQKVLVADDDKNSLLKLEQEILNDYQRGNLLIFEDYNQINWQQVTALILSPGVPLNYPEPHPIVKLARKNNCKIIGDIELLFSANPQASYIGITGTNGKSTTTALIGHVLSELGKKNAVGGNIGKPASSMPRLNNKEFYVLEMSSYQLDLIDKTRFNIAILLNITPDHLDRHKNMEGYIAAKKRIFLNQKSEDYGIISIDNPNSRKVYNDLLNDSRYLGRLVPVSTKEILNNGVSIIDAFIINNLPDSKAKIPFDQINYLRGEHNLENIVAGFTAAVLAGIKNQEKIIKAIKNFKGLKHRLQLVRTIDRVNFVNDSKATNADSTKNALQAYDNIYLILGGRAKEGGIISLIPYFKKLVKAYLIGEASSEFAAILKKNNVKFEECGYLENAFNKAYLDVINDQNNDQDNSKIRNIILSPACASFDQWKNFEARGDYFCQLAINTKVNL